MDTCPHVATPLYPPPAPGATQGCAECPAAAGRWMRLPLCLGRGHLGCCDSAPGGHATAHHQTEHPVIRSFVPGEGRRRYYPDEVIV